MPMWSHPAVIDGEQILDGPGVVARVINELLGNARSYAKSRIAVLVGVKGGLAKLVVKDDGPGVSEPEYESIFERFARGASSVAGGSGSGSGSGIGLSLALALAREAARAHGGDAIGAADDSGGRRETLTWQLA
ncbi:MAG: hypothetical protein CK552_03890 [Actinobacteria bacterium]|nr:MAG: hypothetical protein CK552_03890 [Actinomycetota bacterium]